MANNIDQLVKRFGWNSNSFLALYPGYHYFYLDDPEKGCIAYVKTKRAWVGLTEPLAPIEYRLELIREFSAAAKLEGKGAVLLPVSEDFKELSKSENFRSIQIGSEPFFNLDYYPPMGRDWLDVSHSARALRGKGFQVIQFQFAACKPETRTELTQILNEWFDSRKIGRLGFVNRVEPELLASQKVHFLVEGAGVIWAFVSAIPVDPIHGWYFIDVIRRKGAPAGTVELLMLEAMRQLKAQGVKCVSLGVSPLSREADHSKAEGHSPLDKIENFIFDNVNIFYNFRSLFDFKKKFHPSQWQASYVIHNFGRTDHRIFQVLIECFVPQGAVAAFFQMLKKRLDPLSIVHQAKTWIDQSVILRANPAQAIDWAKRSPLSLSLFFLLGSVFLATAGDTMHLSQYWVANGAYSFQVFSRGDSLPSLLQIFVIPSVLHWNLIHLFSNSVMLIIFGFSLEVFIGSSFFLKTFLFSAFLSNSLTSVLLWCLSKVYCFSIFKQSLLSLDVGASLGIWGCAGAWSFVLKSRRTAWVLFVAALFFAGVIRNDLQQANHIIAAAIGYLVAWRTFGSLRHVKDARSIAD